MARFDAILIPGGGVREGGELPEWVKARLHRAKEIEQGEPIILLSAGTPHKPPPLDAAGFPILESRAGAAYLLQLGLPASQLLTETSSYDTLGNAYFSKQIHVDPLGLRKLLVITSKFHMPRTEAVFRWVYGLGPGSYEMHFEPVSDEGLDPEALAARSRKEAQSLSALQDVRRRVHTPAELHRWLFTRHTVYSAGTDQPAAALEPALLQLY